MRQKFLLSLVFILALAGIFLFAPSPAYAVDISSGDLIKASAPAVYYYGGDGGRYCFPNEKTFFTWYKDFSAVKTITDAELAAVPLKGNVTYRPGSRMVKITSDPRVYAVDAGGTLRWVASETAAVTLYGADWNTKIDDIDDSFFINYKMGADVKYSSDFDKTAIESGAAGIGADKNLVAKGNTPPPTPTPTPTPPPTPAASVPVAPAAPTLSAPTSVSPAVSFNIAWSAPIGAASYILEKSDNLSFSGSSAFYSGVNTSAPDSITGAYYYRVKAQNSVGTSAWSNVIKVEVGCAVPTAPDVTVSKNSAQAGESFTVNRTNVSGAVSYVVERATDAVFSDATALSLTNSDNFNTSEIFSPTADTVYYYRAKAINNCGSSAWSSVASIMVAKAATISCSVPVVPVLTNLGAATVNVPFAVRWSSSAGATSYYLQRSTTADFAAPSHIPGIQTAEYSQTIAQTGTLYYRVKASNGCGSSAWSNAVSVTVAQACTAPTPSPVLTNLGAATVNVPFAVRWSSSAGATSYYLQRSTTADFAAPSHIPGIQTAEYSQTIAQTGTLYYRVKAVNSCGESAWSNAEDVIVAPSGINVPANYATIQAAIDAAQSGQTVNIAAGTYHEHLTMKNGVNLKGAGPGLTIIDGDATGQPIYASGVTATIEGLTVQNSNYYGMQIWNLSQMMVKNCIVKNNPRGIGLGAGGYSTIKNNLILFNTEYGIAVGSGTHQIENNTFVANKTGYYGSGGTILANNIFTDNTVGINGTASINLFYNNVYGSLSANYQSSSAGAHDMSLDPKFIPNSNYHLQGTSPCIDAGAPTFNYSNEPAPNGGRINMGAYGNTSEAEIKS